MDLHDFDDVAENYDLYLGEMFKDEDNHAGFQEFYLDFAKQYGAGGVIDIACGTGAVLLYLAEHGIMADGTDLSAAMCRVADEKAKSKGYHINIFPANMTEFRSDKKYSCAIIARSGFMHLLTPELQRAALLNIRENLSDGGMLTFNTFDPQPFFQAQQMKTKDTDYSFRLEYTNKKGLHEKIYNAISYDPYTQIMSGNWKFETLDSNGNVVEERIRPLKMRQTYRQEMKYLLELTGYKIVNVYGGYHKESAAASANNVIWCVQKRIRYFGKQHIKGGRSLDMSRNSLSALPDYNNCLVNLSNSILKKFSARTTAGTLSLADKYLEGEYQNVVLLILDGMGTSIIERHLEENGFFRSYMAGTLDSVYPPTTVAATTSILSGSYPNEHGWLGWDIYYPQINKNVTVFLNTEQQKEKENAVPSAADPDGKKRWAEDSLEEAFPAAAYNVGFQYTPYKNIIEIINESGGSAYAAMPFMPPYPQSADAILNRVEKLCHEPGRKFIYAYWNEPDSTMHKTGTKSPETHRTVTMLEKMVEKTVSGLSDTLFLITADHGHIDSKNDCLLDYPEIMRCLVRPPSFEPRTLNLFVKDEYKETFPKIFNKYFGDSFVLLTKDEALSERLFGTGNDRDGLEDMIGDYIALAISDKSIFITHFHTQEMPGVHAGLTEAERKIPFIVIEKK